MQIQKENVNLHAHYRFIHKSRDYRDYKLENSNLKTVTFKLDEEFDLNSFSMKVGHPS